MQIRQFTGQKEYVVVGQGSQMRIVGTQIRIRAVREIIWISPDPDPHSYIRTGEVQGLEAYECLSHDSQGLGDNEQAFFLPRR